jgi:hypothetical protein
MSARVFRPLRRGTLVVALLTPGLLLAGCAGGEEEQQAEPENEVYFGWLLAESRG